MSALIKICGVTRRQDADVVAGAGADMIGINFWPGSKRFATADAAREVAAAARSVNPAIEVVGVFVNASDAEIEAADRVAGLDWIQLHGDEEPERVASLGERAFKAISVTGAADIERAAQFPGVMLLLDAASAGYGGSGQTFDWTLAAAIAARGRRWLLAGGLTADNVAAALASAKPTGVDVASGVESAPGIKDAIAVRAFIDAVRRTV